MSSGTGTSSQPRLGPAWRSTHQGGRGFQPPPAADAESRETAPRRDSNRNSFSVLGADDETSTVKAAGEGSGGAFSRAKSMPFSSRSDSLRTTGGGTLRPSSSALNTKSAGSGRSLADLAARQGMTRTHSTHATGVSGRRPSSGFEEAGSGLGPNSRASSMRNAIAMDEKKVIRYTREKLLSMRPRPGADSSRPENLVKILDGTPLLSDVPIDPVCWDTFDAEVIWQAAKVARGGPSPAGKATSSRIPLDVRGDPDDRKNRGGPGRWQRGIALPPAEDSGRGGRSGRYEDADHPDDLWDDPSTPQAAASDFSAFGGSLDDEPRTRGGSVGSDGFDLNVMSEMSKKFDEDIHGTNRVDTSDSPKQLINPLRPLADAGTTIKSGSGDDVNVFEDFGAPDESGTNGSSSIKAGSEEQSASSRLMQMIGVTPETKDTIEPDTKKAKESDKEEVLSNMFPGFSSSVPSNPWGDPVIPSHESNKQSSIGLDLSALTLQREQSQEEEERRRLQEKKRQQAEQEAALQRQQASQTQQHQQQHDQVERILTERVSAILENSWGRCELSSILQNLHTEDPRVIPLLGSVDALRALLARHPLRIRLAKDATFGTEMAVLLMDNAQWQQHTNEELKRRRQEEQKNILAHQQAAAVKAKVEAEARAQEAKSEKIIITDDPWFYADPQGNVQGPFGGEEMRQWLEAGYFKGDLPISQRSDGPFHTLSTLFPDISIAFKPTAPSEDKITGPKFVEKEMVHESADQVVEAREVVEQEEETVTESKPKTDEVITISSTNQNQSDQLKMLLGLGGSQDELKPEKKVSIAGPPVKTESKIDEEGKDSQFQNKSSETKLYKKAPDVSSTSTPAPAWGGAGAGKSLGRKKSMSEIQKEEATVAARLAKHKVSSNANSSSGWASIAKSGGMTAWSGNTVVSSTKIPNTSNSSSIHGISNTNNPSSRVKQQVSSMSQAQGLTQRTSTQQTMEEFGANEKMTPSLESWCKEQMRKLSDNDDLTLVAFCMTLADPGEIKQYLTAYLGSTPQVHSFAAEFINRKSGTQKQEEWETTSSNKKGRKKKGGLLAK